MRPARTLLRPYEKQADDTVIAAGTDRTIVRYKLADRLKAFMLARIALDLFGGEVKSSAHGVGPVKTDPAIHPT